MTDHDKLRALAEGATPKCSKNKNHVTSAEHLACDACFVPQRAWTVFCRAMTPDVVIALLDEISALKKKIPGDPRDGVNWGGK